MPIVTVGPVQLYYEVRGSRPPVLFIMGATGDAGHFATVAEQLADEFTALTYDRRGNSRSSRPPGWDTTTVEEQADDAAGLLRALELAPAAVFGSSSGAICAMSLLVRHPELVRAAILHEPPMLSVVERPDDVRAAVGQLVEAGMAAGGPPAALERSGALSPATPTGRAWRRVCASGCWETPRPSWILRGRSSPTGPTMRRSRRSRCPCRCSSASRAIGSSPRWTNGSPRALALRCRPRRGRTPPTTTTRTSWLRQSGLS
jgi:pimeloyl-ACP methyl ester carboxylesterase